MGRGEDKISCLPNELLPKILTIIPLKSAVRTDILSKRWRNLWKYSLSTSTSLEFGEDFANNLSAKEFVKTVNRYLLLNQSQELQSFHFFFCPFDLFSSDIQRWISFATGKKVKFLDIDLSQGFRNPKNGEFIDGRSPFELPSSLFRCDSLIDLSLSRCDFTNPLKIENFGGLQSLSISHSNINEEMLQSILTECSVLESLSLRSCQNLQFISIMAPDLKLRKLTIGDCWPADLLEISAPNLRSFHYFGRFWVENILLNFDSLEDASIYSIGGYSQTDYTIFLSSLSNVQILTLSTETLVHLNLNEESYDNNFQFQLQNLRELQLLMTSMADEDLTCFYTLFSRCSFPFIEKFFIKLPEHIDDPNEEKYEVRVRLNPVGLEDFTFAHLKLIKMTNFKGSSNEMRLVSFLLQKAAILETLVLVLPTVKKGGGEERMVLRILKGRVSLLRKTSPNVRIILHEVGEDDGFIPTHVEIYNDDNCLPWPINTLYLKFLTEI